MLIKDIRADVKDSARKRTAIKMLFYTSIEAEMKVFHSL